VFLGPIDSSQTATYGNSVPALWLSVTLANVTNDERKFWCTWIQRQFGQSIAQSAHRVELEKH